MKTLTPVRTMSDVAVPKTFENEKNNLPEKSKEKFGTRHLQVLLMSLSLTIGYAINLSLPVAIIAMTDPKVAQFNFKYYEWTTSEISLVLSSFMWGYAALQIPSGYLAKIWSARKLFALGLFVSSIINLLLPFLTYYGDWIALCIGRAIIGLCHGTFSSCTHTLLSKWSPPVERSRMSAFVTTGSVLGGVLAMSLSGVIAASSLSWPGIFYVFGGLGVASSIIFFLFVRDSPSRHKKISPFEKAFITNSFQQIANHCEIERKRIPWKEILTSTSVWALIIVECGSTWGQWSVNIGIPTYMKYVLNYNIAANGLFSTLPYLANWLLSFPFSWAADYAMRKKVSVIIIRRISNTVGLWGPAVMLVVLCLVGTENGIVPVALLVLSVGLKAGTSSGYIVNLIDLSPNFAGTIYSITTCFGSLISIMAPIVSGKIVVDMTNTAQWHIVFYTTAFIYFSTNFVFIIFSKGEIQSWNNPTKNKESVSTIYDPKTVKNNP